MSHRLFNSAHRPDEPLAHFLALFLQPVSDAAVLLEDKLKKCLKKFAGRVLYEFLMQDGVFQKEIHHQCIADVQLVRHLWRCCPCVKQEQKVGRFHSLGLSLSYSGAVLPDCIAQ